MPLLLPCAMFHMAGSAITVVRRMFSHSLHAGSNLSGSLLGIGTCVSIGQAVPLTSDTDVGLGPFAALSSTAKDLMPGA